MTTEILAEHSAQKSSISSSQELNCGIIMPIATMGSYSAGHWSDVKQLLSRAITKAGFTARLVSESEDARVIQTSIVQNIYDDPIIVCDVSGKNPNVMFELGMRLAFNKPVVIVVDGETGFSFDTSPIEHIIYRRDLRIIETEDFINNLASKVRATYENSSKPEYRTFLSNFSHIQVAQIESTSITPTGMLEKLLQEIQNTKSLIKNNAPEKQKNQSSNQTSTYRFDTTTASLTSADKILNLISKKYGQRIVDSFFNSTKKQIIVATRFLSIEEQDLFIEYINSMIKDIETTAQQDDDLPF